MEWISVKDRLPEISQMYSRVSLPMYVRLNNGTITIADYTKRKFKQGQEWIGVNYNPIWICRSRGEEISDTQVYPTHWMPLPEPPKNQ